MTRLRTTSHTPEPWKFASDHSISTDMEARSRNDQPVTLSFHGTLHESVMQLIDSCRRFRGADTQVEGELVLTPIPPLTSVR